MSKPWLSGTANGRAKLTEKLVEAIRGETGTQKQIAVKYKISASQVGSIRRRVSWSHISGPEKE